MDDRVVLAQHTTARMTGQSLGLFLVGPAHIFNQIAEGRSQSMEHGFADVSLLRYPCGFAVEVERFGNN
ncbi:MAG: hypothetical protein QGF00_08415 [Planctomycetota bacterium]|nr:hypothetical protein [Planctomycetota bacterium]